MTSAAIIMVAVFAVFGTLSVQQFKQLAVGLAISVLIGATVIRAVLLPSVMVLLGDRNWYLPRWLGRFTAGGAGRRPPPPAARQGGTWTPARAIAQPGGSMTEAVLTDDANGVLVITINRPEARNAVNAEVARGLAAALDALDGRDDLNVGVMTAPAARSAPEWT